MAEKGTTLYYLSPPLLLILVATALLFCRLETLSLSVDEFVNVRIDCQSLSSIAVLLREGADLHPPLTHWLSHIWIQLFGASEWALRSVWAFCGVMTVACTYRLAALLGTRWEGILGALLLAFLSTFLLYTRFVKYYALTMLLSVAVFIAFYRYVQKPAIKPLLAYIFLLIAFLYTDYFGPALCLIWQDLFVGIQFLRRRICPKGTVLLNLLGAQAIAFLFWAPWLRGVWHQIRIVHSLQEADAGKGLFAFVLKVAYAHYSFGLGETLFPWNPLAVVGITGFLVAWTTSLLALARGQGRLSVWTGTFSLLSFGLLAGLTSSVIVGVPFIAFANHILFVLPFFSLWLAAGILTIRPRAILWLTVLSILAGRLAGVLNYFGGREFHNPIYVIPTRDIVKQLVMETQPGDLVLAAGDIGVDFYASRTPGWHMPVLDTSDLQKVQDAVNTLQPKRIWLFVFGRDRTRDVHPSALQEFLADRCNLWQMRGYAEQDALYRYIKEQLFQRPAYRYKLSLYIYVCQ